MDAPINLAQLQVFDTVARAGSVTGAADALHKTPSSVTRAIQEVEAALGHDLFERRRSGMLLSPVGRAVRQRVQRLLAELAEFAQWCDLLRSRRPQPRRDIVPAYLLNTHRLLMFAALCRHRNMKSVAEAMSVSQPAVSAAIRALEAGAQLRLFDRSPRGVEPTVEGETLLLRIRRALNEMHHIRGDIAALQGLIVGTVTVGALPPVRAHILPQAIARLELTNPGVCIVTDERAYDQMLTELRAGDIDFVLGGISETPPPGDLITETLMLETMCLLAGRDHPLAGATQVGIAECQRYSWILPRKHSLARKLIDDHFRRKRRKTPIAKVETGDLAIIRGLLLSTDMVAVLSPDHLHQDVASGHVVRLNADLGGLARRIGFTFRSHGTPSPAAMALMRAVRNVAGEIEASARRS
jgi:LysR family transcriptional regulator, regulator for genes of the gallate degradation pathway